DRPQKGRFREFIQCDVDTVGSDSKLADAETLLAVTEALAGLGLEGFEVQLNSRRALRGLIAAYGVPEALEETTLVALDKLDKVGVDGVAAELRDRDLPSDAVEAIADDLGSGDLETAARERITSSERGRAGLDEVDTVLGLVAPHLTDAGSIRFAPALARGLSYYTGPIFEITHPGIGSSIASGGRYDGLVGMFSNREIPAVGGSIGVDRVLMLLDGGAVSAAPPVVVTILDDDLREDALSLAIRLRRQGIDADLFASSAKLGKQFKYADRRGIRYALIRGDDEVAAGTVAVKDLETGEQTSVPEDLLADHLRNAIAGD
ncbi:MAG: ATP phosphoribosyltransferase regulatory subunit, partial [Nitriliruptorales bacterium]|nr:ATP phosphoribosyltransferase regulatory subunit [Nitriliruptorales bacterium]